MPMSPSSSKVDLFLDKSSVLLLNMSYTHGSTNNEIFNGSEVSTTGGHHSISTSHHE